MLEAFERHLVGTQEYSTFVESAEECDSLEKRIEFCLRYLKKNAPGELKLVEPKPATTVKTTLPPWATMTVPDEFIIKDQRTETDINTISSLDIDSSNKFKKRYEEVAKSNYINEPNKFVSNLLINNWEVRDLKSMDKTGKYVTQYMDLKKKQLLEQLYDTIEEHIEIKELTDHVKDELRIQASINIIPNNKKVT